jgi:hypothetical protein
MTKQSLQLGKEPSKATLQGDWCGYRTNPRSLPIMWRTGGNRGIGPRERHPDPYPGSFPPQNHTCPQVGAQLYGALPLNRARFPRHGPVDKHQEDMTRSSTRLGWEEFSSVMCAGSMGTSIPAFCSRAPWSLVPFSINQRRAGDFRVG